MYLFLVHLTPTKIIERDHFKRAQIQKDMEITIRQTQFLKLESFQGVTELTEGRNLKING